MGKEGEKKKKRENLPVNKLSLRTCIPSTGSRVFIDLTLSSDSDRPTAAGSAKPNSNDIIIISSDSDRDVARKGKGKNVLYFSHFLLRLPLFTPVTTAEEGKPPSEAGEGEDGSSESGESCEDSEESEASSDMQLSDQQGRERERERERICIEEMLRLKLASLN